MYVAHLPSSLKSFFNSVIDFVFGSKSSSLSTNILAGCPTLYLDFILFVVSSQQPDKIWRQGAAMYHQHLHCSSESNHVGFLVRILSLMELLLYPPFKHIQTHICSCSSGTKMPHRMLSR